MTHDNIASLTFIDTPIGGVNSLYNNLLIVGQNDFFFNIIYYRIYLRIFYRFRGLRPKQ